MESTAPRGSWKSAFEEAYYGRHHYFQGSKIPDWSPSPTPSPVLESSDVPYFQVGYARMMQDGQWVVGQSRIFSRFTMNTLIAARCKLVKADYLMSKISYGDNSYRKFTGEIIDLLRSGMERGTFIHGTMADAQSWRHHRY